MLIFNHQPDLSKGKGGLWFYKPGMKESIQITDGPDDKPLFSPNGKLIVFNRKHPYWNLDVDIMLLQYNLTGGYF